MAFKLKSGNTSSFKSMGSSPAKQDLQGKLQKQGKHYKKTTRERIDTPRGKNEFPKKEDIQKQADYTSTQANIKPNEWNDPYTKRDKYGDEIKKESPAKQVKGNMPKDFNMKGSKGSTTPGYSTTKAAKKSMPKNFNTKGSASSKTPGYSTTSKAKANIGKTVVKKVAKKQLLKKVVTKIGSRLIPGVGWGLAAYDAGKWIHKNKKGINKHAEEVGKKRLTNPGDHGRPKY